MGDGILELFFIDDGLLGAATATGYSYFSYCGSSFLSFFVDEYEAMTVTVCSSFIFWSFAGYWTALTCFGSSSSSTSSLRLAINFSNLSSWIIFFYLFLLSLFLGSSWEGYFSDGVVLSMLLLVSLFKSGVKRSCLNSSLGWESFWLEKEWCDGSLSEEEFLSLFTRSLLLLTMKYVSYSTVGRKYLNKSGLSFFMRSRISSGEMACPFLIWSLINDSTLVCNLSDLFYYEF